MAARFHPLVIARGNGVVLAQNGPARQLMGDGLGKPCWDVVGGICGAEGLPCSPGGPQRLLAHQPARATTSAISLLGERYHLACVPTNDFVLCMINRGATAAPQAQQPLTSRERQVLRMLAEGENTTIVSDRLGLSESTVRTHVEHMRLKLGARTRAELVALGFRLGYLD